MKNLIIFFGLIALTACNSEQRQWDEAQKKYTIEGYESFYENNPNSEFSQIAIEEIWKLLLKKDSLELFEDFINKHNDSKFAEKAFNEIWRIYEKQNTINGYQKFINKYPYSNYIAKAKDGIKTIWTAWKPQAPKIEVQSNLSVSLTWQGISYADSYIVYWSRQKDFKINKNNSESVVYESFDRDNANTYGDRLPMYYRISAVKDSIETVPSDANLAKLLPSNGKTCQICGAESIGYCEVRNVYVCENDHIFTMIGGGQMQCP